MLNVFLGFFAGIITALVLMGIFIVRYFHDIWSGPTVEPKKSPGNILHPARGGRING